MIKKEFKWNIEDIGRFRRSDEKDDLEHDKNFLSCVG